MAGCNRIHVQSVGGLLGSLLCVWQLRSLAWAAASPAKPMTDSGSQHGQVHSGTRQPVMSGTESPQRGPPQLLQASAEKAQSRGTNPVHSLAHAPGSGIVCRSCG